MKRGSRPAGDSMHETAPFVSALRRKLRFLVPRKWLVLDSWPGPGSARRARRPTRARIELDAGSPASSWVAWEVSRRGRPS